ncbi:hypothetical protein T484DRAFT_1844839 [Baffinella frigidus]|nr:hypothetical protein T484DRAFT_1844839 [Cryptophyta sp. CCMP2293]
MAHRAPVGGVGAAPLGGGGAFGGGAFGAPKPASTFGGGGMFGAAAPAAGAGALGVGAAGVGQGAQMASRWKGVETTWFTTERFLHFSDNQTANAGRRGVRGATGIATGQDAVRSLKV